MVISYRRTGDGKCPGILTREKDNFVVNEGANMKTILYGNGGCGNHGCEAIVRGTYELFKKPLIISSENIDEDRRYGLEEFCDIYDAKAGSPGKLQFVKAYMKLYSHGWTAVFIYN